MRRALLLLVPALVAAGCARDTPIDNITWQITDVYQAGYPSEVPTDTIVVPRMTFGHTSIVGDTGCAPFHAHITYLDEHGNTAAPLEAPTVAITDLRVDSLREGCVGRGRFLHDSLVDLLPHQFNITREAGSLLLTQADVAVDAPALRMVNSQ
ncbi:hypothetical protein C1Y63_05765 [Corynebacterium sp. 13CS0277]|uniref:hypothetical protein n=1 Tax=Corynebacterium sp. 13CS0277 TaxID=2071994 RepID=UPI000D03FF09|nr:hypothetical protein [Corynebacterium sp. 13CS0277]PRQ11508.1 hypothetical protein C1Y63_05765 [Corynebacterium sp. 13CS0277]